MAQCLQPERAGDARHYHVRWFEQGDLRSGIARLGLAGVTPSAGPTAFETAKRVGS
jgi:hypothetical protein